MSGWHRQRGAPSGTGTSDRLQPIGFRGWHWQRGAPSGTSDRFQPIGFPGWHRQHGVPSARRTFLQRAAIAIARQEKKAPAHPLSNPYYFVAGAVILTGRQHQGGRSAAICERCKIRGGGGIRSGKGAADAGRCVRS